MPKLRKHASQLSSSPDEIEAEFYEAMQAGDIDRLMACWADEEDIVCVHPGGSRLVGVGAIRSGFEALFNQGDAIRVKPEQVHSITAMASAVHSVIEKIEVLTQQGPAHAYALATNVYHRTPQGWRIVMHHASAGLASEAREEHHSSKVLH